MGIERQLLATFVLGGVELLLREEAGPGGDLVTQGDGAGVVLEGHCEIGQRLVPTALFRLMTR